MREAESEEILENRDIIVVGASMGGIEALKEFVGGLPADLPASIFIVLHVAPSSPALLPEILVRSGRLPVSNAVNGVKFESGHIYVAVPDRHLILDQEGRMRVTGGPKENRSRPAIDPLFRSAAVHYGPRVVGIILSGLLDDGSAGLWAVKEAGGAAIVQDPNEALARSMPANAKQRVQVDYCVSVKEIAPLIVKLANSPSKPKVEFPMAEKLEIEVKIASEANAVKSGILEWGKPSLFACPECHGILLQFKEGDILRFRCHTGHAYSLETLLEDFTEKTEEALWNAVRSMEETTILLQKIAAMLAEHNNPAEAEMLLKRARELQAQTELIRKASIKA